MTIPSLRSSEAAVCSTIASVELDWACGGLVSSNLAPAGHHLHAAG